MSATTTSNVGSPTTTRPRLRSRAPDWVLDRVLASVDTTPQRRTVLGWPWRFLNMPFSAKLALTAVAIVAVGLVGLTLVQVPAVGPPASPSPTASPSPLTRHRR